MKFQTVSGLDIEQAEKEYAKEHLQLPGINGIDVNHHLPSIFDLLGDIPPPPVRTQLYSTHSSPSPPSRFSLPLPQPPLGPREVSINCAKTTVRSLSIVGQNPRYRNHRASPNREPSQNDSRQLLPNTNNLANINSQASISSEGFGPNSKTYHPETVLSRPAEYLNESSSLQVGPNSDNRPSIYTICRIVDSHTPKVVSERWFPRGLFKGKSLKELLKELLVGEWKGLIFTIESSFMRTVERILNDDEDGFASMKRYVNRQIWDWFIQQRHLGDEISSRIVLEISIEFVR